MKQETSQWGKAVKKAVIDHDMTLKQLAEKIGYSNATVSQVVNGRYSNSSYKVIAEKINEVLGTEGLPERTETPSDEWCQTVKVELVKQSMTVNELAKQLDVSRDRLSLVINGKMMNEAIEIWNNEDGPIARITVCIAGSGLAEDETVIDTNNCPWAMEFIKQHGFGQATGRMVKSGYCTYPVVKLDIEKIGEYLEVA